MALMLVEAGVGADWLPQMGPWELRLALWFLPQGLVHHRRAFGRRWNPRAGHNSGKTSLTRRADSCRKNTT